MGNRLEDMRFEGLEPPRFDWRFFLVFWAIDLLLPRYAYWSRWPSRLSGSRLALYLAFKVGQGMAIRYWVVPWFRRAGRVREELRAELRERLGREPTEEEIFEYVNEGEG